MNSAPLDEAVSAVQALRKQLGKAKTRQVKQSWEKVLVKATVFAWFNVHRVKGLVTPAEASVADEHFSRLLAMAERDSARARYKHELKALCDELIVLRDLALRTGNASTVPGPLSPTPPNFAKVVQDAAFQAILERRWRETAGCLGARAHLAAAIMLGGLLEALLLAKAKSLKPMAPLFKAKFAPKDKTGNPKSNLKEWHLFDFIQVAHELGWIGAVAKSVGHVVRDFRNLVHPNEEFERKITLDDREALALVSVFHTIATELLS